MDTIDITSFDHLYPGWNERLAIVDKGFKLSANVWRHVDPDLYFVTIYDLELLSLTAIKKAVPKTDVYLFIKLLVSEAMDYGNLIFDTRPDGPAIDGDNPDYQTVLAAEGEEYVMKYESEESRKEFELARVENIPSWLVTDPQLN